MDPNLPEKVYETSYSVKKINQYVKGIYIKWASELSYEEPGGWIVDRLTIRTLSATGYPFLHFLSWDGIDNVAIELKDGSVLAEVDIGKVAWKEAEPYLEYWKLSEGLDESELMSVPLVKIASIKKLTR